MFVLEYFFAFILNKKIHFQNDDKLVLEFALEEDRHEWSLSWSNFIFALFFKLFKTKPMIMSKIW